MEGLCSAHYCCCCLESNTNDVVVRLLSGQHGACSLGMNAEHHGFCFLSMETFFQNGCPETTGCTEFSNFFKYVVVSVPEEGQAACEIIDFQTGFQSCFDVSDTISDGESDFLSSSGACFTDMVTGDGNGVPLRYILGAVFKNVGNQTHRRFNRENIGSAGCVFFQNIVLNGAAELIGRYALLFSNCDVHSQQYGCRCVDCHGCGNFAQINLVKKDFHIFQGIDCYAYLTDFADSHFVIRVIADLGRKVECAGQAGAAIFNQVTITFVGFFSGSKACIHTHSPETAAVHGRLYAAGIRIFARDAEVSFIIKTFDIKRCIHLIVF